ncbi:MAG: VOC family protein [Alphaproteobacteria bacterium]|nr:VOC family protein [Alphaproteobacteria bacterium]
MPTAAYPQLFVRDIRAACDWFGRVLGFATVFQHGEPPFYAQVAREGARINLRCVDQPVFVEGIREAEVLLSAYLVVDDVDALFAEMRRSGAEFQQEPTEQPWGVRDFVVRDPDGNLLLFASR